MNLKVCLTFVLASIACGSQARDLQAIQQSGELKVGVPGDYAPLAFHNEAGETARLRRGYGKGSGAEAGA